MSLKEQFGQDIVLTGWRHSRFGKLTEETLESLTSKSPVRPLPTPDWNKNKLMRST